MKAYFQVLVLFCMASCYSVQFYPTDDYPILRRADVDDVEVTTRSPRQAYDVLGHLVIRDPAVDIYSETFQRFVAGEAEDRGATGAWIQRVRQEHTVIGTTANTNPSGRYSQEEEISLQTMVIQIVLYNYREEESPDR